MALEFWKKKSGPLPNWAWGAIGLGGAVAYASWRKNKESGEGPQEAESTTSIQLPESVQPTYAFVDADTTNITWPTYPPGGGRPPTPTPTPKPTPTPRPTPKPTPTPTPTPKPAPPGAPVGKYVTVAKWTPKNTPWNSTVWGITTKLLGPKAQWQSVWNAPQNAALKKKRGAPEKVQPGDRIWVPGAK